MHHKGFTLIELLVVIVIIGILVTLGISSYDSAISGSRDAKRKSDLQEISLALDRYYLKYGTYKLDRFGASFTAPKCGCGWFGYETGPTTYYELAVSRGLYEEGFLVDPLVDDPQQNPGYMIYICEGGTVYSVSATLENPSAEDTAAAQKVCNGTGGNGVVSRYGKNYAVTNAACGIDATTSCGDADGQFKP